MCADVFITQPRERDPVREFAAGAAIPLIHWKKTLEN
jgi:hypothetical protein